ncbi:hypothetical protein GGI13_000782 [Coemansia sp. RSA 455]|nr:hypothetical protein GGI13_000782 [Coemansia sp. RSA 455]
MSVAGPPLTDQGLDQSPDHSGLGICAEDLFLRTELQWNPRKREEHWAVVTVNVNGMPLQAVAVEEIEWLMEHLQLDVLALQETHMQAKDAEALAQAMSFKGWRAAFSCAPDTIHAQKGVAVILSARAAQHLMGYDVIWQEAPRRQQREEMRVEPVQIGTGLWVRLAYARETQLHIIILYTPPQGMGVNMMLRQRTQEVATGWLNQVKGAGHKVIVLGDLNEDLAAGGPMISDLGHALRDRDWMEDAHEEVRATIPTGTTVERNGVCCRWIDYIFFLKNLGAGVQQAVLATETTNLGEDHQLIAAEVAVDVGRRGPASGAPACRLRLDTAGSSEEQREQFRRDLEQVTVTESDLDEATGCLFRKIAEAVHKCAEMMNGNLGGMV